MSSAADTKEQILDVAEQEIAEHGYAGTTLRNIVSKANVNLAAVHYHFGSKEALFEALIARIAKPIVAGHLAALSEMTANVDELPSVEAVLKAYVKPSFDTMSQDKKAWPVRAKFIGRCRTEPAPVQGIAEKQFRPSTELFLDVLQRVLPDQSRSQLNWKLDLVVSSLIRVLGEAGKPGALLQSDKATDIDKAVTQLVAFLLPGLESS